MDPNKESQKLRAGHMARADRHRGIKEASKALRTSGIQWWRDAQAQHRSKWDGVHPKRFSCLVWEAQMTEFQVYKQEWQIKQHKRQYGVGNKKTQNRENGKKTKNRKDNSGSSSSLKKRNKRKQLQHSTKHAKVFWLTREIL